MVEGLERFGEYFADYADQYLLIGGAACTLAMEEAGVDFRATKDLDIVLCVEALTAEFVQTFWEFVNEGAYEIQQSEFGKRQFYRFQHPTSNGFPFMLELFSRNPDAFPIAPGSHLTPIPANGDIASLSAILLDNDYYAFLQSGRRVIDRIPIVGSEHLIPLKARAWLDLSNRKATGIRIDSRDIKKHKNDVFRLFAVVDPNFAGNVPQQVKADLSDFIEAIRQETVDLKALGLRGQSLESILEELKSVYQL